MKKNEKRDMKKQDLAILVSTNNDCVCNDQPRELLNSRARRHGSSVFLSNLAVEVAKGHCNQGWHAGSPGAHGVLERQTSLTQFERSTT